MGFGDVKLMAMIGAFLGTKLTVLTIFAASLAGSLFGLSTVLAVWMKRRRRNEAHAASARISSSTSTEMEMEMEISSNISWDEARISARRRAWRSARLALRYYEMPFGVFLGGMAILSFLFGNQLLHWYWRAL
jgi:prepilin signal peptidase PulO-like enzyme (type II secretory pathway)